MFRRLRTQSGTRLSFTKTSIWNRYVRHTLLYMYVQSWPKISAPLVNMIKEGCENESALLILLIIYLKKSKKCLTFHWIIRILNGGKYQYEIQVHLDKLECRGKVHLFQ